MIKLYKLAATKTKKWYTGTYTPYKNPPDSPVFFVGGDYDRHWTANAVRDQLAFILKHKGKIAGALLSASATAIIARLFNLF